eukprot:13032-Heterococcus_DN1.PRE.1
MTTSSSSGGSSGEKRTWQQHQSVLDTTVCAAFVILSALVGSDDVFEGVQSTNTTAVIADACSALYAWPNDISDSSNSASFCSASD